MLLRVRERQASPTFGVAEGSKVKRRAKSVPNAIRAPKMSQTVPKALQNVFSTPRGRDVLLAIVSLSDVTPTGLPSTTPTFMQELRTAPRCGRSLPALEERGLRGSTRSSLQQIRNGLQAACNRNSQDPIGLRPDEVRALGTQIGPRSIYSRLHSSKHR